MAKSWTLNSDKRVEPSTQDGEKSKATDDRGGYGFWLSACFMIAQVSGAGFLPLPKALARTGWTGIPMLLIFCFIGSYSANRIGRCTNILEERWPEEYQKPSRQPYMDITYRAYGERVRKVVRCLLMGNLFGGSIIFIIINAEMFSGLVPSLSQCQWTLIVGFGLLPFTFLGTPKDFWQASVTAVASTIVAVIVIVYKLIHNNIDTRVDIPPPYETPTLSSFSLGYGAILFAYGGVAVFPTIQNDMRDRAKFSLGVKIAFLGVLALYIPVAATGYYFLGSDVQSNILLSIGSDAIVLVAMALQIVNLLATYLITFSPLAQAFEDLLQVPSTFGWKRVMARTSLVVAEILVSLAVPDFGMIVNLLGGSAVAILSFILPVAFYTKLVKDTSNEEWPKRTISIYETILLWVIIIVGVVGAISSTIFALMNILSPESFGKSCFVDFSRRDDTLLKFSGLNVTASA